MLKAFIVVVALGVMVGVYVAALRYVERKERELEEDTDG